MRFYKKIILLIGLLASAVAVSQLPLIYLMYAFGLSSESDLHEYLAADPSHNFLMALKSALAFGHLLIFIATPLLYLRITFQCRGFIDTYEPRFKLVVHFLFMLFCITPVIVWLTQQVQFLPLPTSWTELDDNYKVEMTTLLKMNAYSDLLINIIVIGLLPGIGEELLFRGIIQKELENKTRKAHFAILLGAFLFAVFHFQIVGFPAKFLIGWVLGLSYYYSRNIFVPMTIHFFNNTMSVINYFYLAQSKTPEQDLAETPINIFLVFSAGIVSLWLLNYIRINYPSQNIS